MQDGLWYVQGGLLYVQEGFWYVQEGFWYVKDGLWCVQNGTGGFMMMQKGLTVDEIIKQGIRLWLVVRKDYRFYFLGVLNIYHNHCYLVSPDNALLLFYAIDILNYLLLWFVMK